MEPQRGPSGAGISGSLAPPADVTRLAARSFETRLASGSFERDPGRVGRHQFYHSPLFFLGVTQSNRLEAR